MGKGRKPKKGTRGARDNASKRFEPEDDTALWNAFTQNIDPLELKGRVPDTEPSLLDEMLKRQAAKTERPVPPSTATAKPRIGPGTAVVPKENMSKPSVIDAKEVRRVGKGRSGIDARIDLHGMRQHEAHAALRVFLFRCAAKGHRMVLVITGKGAMRSTSGDEKQFGGFINEALPDRGVLRRNVPLWLAEPDLRGLVVGHTMAHIRHGGEGALYVQLRRKR